MSKNALNLSIIIPIKNEGGNIETVLNNLINQVDVNVEIITCYDLDNDSSISYIKNFLNILPNLKIIKNEFNNRGYIGAIQTGINHAKHKAVLILNGDMSDEINDIKYMLTLFNEGNDIIVASRYSTGGKLIGDNKIKSILSKIANITFKYIANIQISDITNSFKLYDYNFLKSIEIESKQSFELAMELTIKAILQNKKIKEIPTTWTDRTCGKSNFSFLKINGYIYWYIVGFISIWKMKLCK